jgi:hypothetical protein
MIGASIGRVVRRLFGLFRAVCAIAIAIVGSNRGGEEGGVDVDSEGSDES